MLISAMSSWKTKAQKLRNELYALYLAYRDPRVPWYAKAFAACVVAYAASPIDVIPDFIPVLGYLDDAILVPLGIYLALKMIPEAVMEECRQKTRVAMARRHPARWIAAAIILALWLLLAALAGTLLLRVFAPGSSGVLK